MEAIGNRAEVDEERDDVEDEERDDVDVEERGDVLDCLGRQPRPFSFLRLIGEVVEGPSVTTVVVVVSTTVGE